MKLSKTTYCLLLLFTCTASCMFAQEPDEYEVLPWKEYKYPTEPEVLANLREWQDLKFGLFIHWGTYSRWGIFH